jgi:hypothetical protein
LTSINLAFNINHLDKSFSDKETSKFMSKREREREREGEQEREREGEHEREREKK